MVEKSNYPKHNWSTFSVTELFKGPKEIILSRRHADEIEVDVAEMAAILIGNAVHDYLISVVGTQELSEERVNAPLDTQYGTIYISGAFDLYDAMAKHLYDVKVPSAMSLQFKAKDGYAEWINSSGRTGGFYSVSVSRFDRQAIWLYLPGIPSIKHARIKIILNSRLLRLNTNFHRYSTARKRLR
jgi:hypothetical protein